jgi:hypothetical protein
VSLQHGQVRLRSSHPFMHPGWNACLLTCGSQQSINAPRSARCALRSRQARQIHDFRMIPALNRAPHRMRRYRVSKPQLKRHGDHESAPIRVVSINGEFKPTNGVPPTWICDMTIA